MCLFVIRAAGTELTVRMMREELPFPRETAVLDLRGADWIEAYVGHPALARESMVYSGLNSKCGFFRHCRGLFRTTVLVLGTGSLPWSRLVTEAQTYSLVIDDGRPVGQRVVSVSLRGQPIEPDRLYRVALSEFMARWVLEHRKFS